MGAGVIRSLRELISCKAIQAHSGGVSGVHLPSMERLLLQLCYRGLLLFCSGTKPAGTSLFPELMAGMSSARHLQLPLIKINDIYSFPFTVLLVADRESRPHSHGLEAGFSAALPQRNGFLLRLFLPFLPYGMGLFSQFVITITVTLCCRAQAIFCSSFFSSLRIFLLQPLIPLTLPAVTPRVRYLLVCPQLVTEMHQMQWWWISLLCQFLSSLEERSL